jgi:hypothetical protein
MNLMLLSEVISDERLAKFKYGDEDNPVSWRVAPAEINVDDEGFRILRAFALSPEQGWRTFYLSEILDLEIEGDRL